MPCASQIHTHVESRIAVAPAPGAHGTRRDGRQRARVVVLVATGGSAMRRQLLGVAVSALAACASPPGPVARELVDLSYAFDADTIYWPTEEGFVFERGFSGRTAGGYHYEAHRFRAAEHGGTHLDAPIHFAAGGATTDAIPLEQLVGPAVVIDVADACAQDRDHAVSVADLAAFEAAHGRIPDGAIVLLRTGFGRFWPDRARYLGTAERGAAGVAKLRFPGLWEAAAGWLVAERRVHAVGIDTASIDPGISQRFETHQVLSAAGVPALENLARLDGLPARGFDVVALPMKIAHGSGGPLRAIAIVPQPAR
jgi:kynurenine formamidase